jgi:hypothetical protein
MMALTPGVTRGSVPGSGDAEACDVPPEVVGLGDDIERPDGGCSSDPIEAESYTCTTKCAIEDKSPKCTGWVTGEGTGKTQVEACKAAKKNANDNVGRLLPDEGCKAEHCRTCDCKKK